MTRSRPFLPTVLAALPRDRLGDLASWARQMAEAGADGLVLNGVPEDPIVTGLLSELRRTTALPLELHTPERAEPGMDWPSLLASVGVDWLVPAWPVPAKLCESLANEGIRIAWPARLGRPRAGIPRVHARAPWELLQVGSEESQGIERSLAFSPTSTPSCPPGVDRLILPGESLNGLDPAGQLIKWRLGLSAY